jgi:hypothetical protein
MDRGMARLGQYALLGVVMLFLWGCGNPNVPLTQPPADAFRVATPRPPSPTATPMRLGLGSLTARFFNLPWLDTPPPSLLQLSAAFFGIPFPGEPSPRPVPPPRPQNTPQ